MGPYIISTFIIFLFYTIQFRAPLKIKKKKLNFNIIKITVNKIVRLTTETPFYVTNQILRTDLQTKPIAETV